MPEWQSARENRGDRKRGESYQCMNLITTQKAPHNEEKVDAVRDLHNSFCFSHFPAAAASSPPLCIFPPGGATFLWSMINNFFSTRNICIAGEIIRAAERRSRRSNTGGRISFHVVLSSSRRLIFLLLAVINGGAAPQPAHRRQVWNITYTRCIYDGPWVGNKWDRGSIS